VVLINIHNLFEVEGSLLVANVCEVVVIQVKFNIQIVSTRPAAFHDSSNVDVWPTVVWSQQSERLVRVDVDACNAYPGVKAIGKRWVPSIGGIFFLDRRSIDMEINFVGSNSIICHCQRESAASEHKKKFARRKP
jgi:hypothetical protein